MEHPVCIIDERKKSRIDPERVWMLVFFNSLGHMFLHGFVCILFNCDTRTSALEARNCPYEVKSAISRKGIDSFEIFKDLKISFQPILTFHS